MFIYLCIVSVIILFFLGVYLTRQKSKGLPVLMYHKISNDHADELTILYEDFINQMKFLHERKYITLNFSDLSSITKLPPKSVILTFDDAYASLPELLHPVLTRFGFKATVFVPVSYIGKTNDWDEGIEPVTSEEMLKTLDKKTFEIGLHGYRHINYRHLSLEETRQDLENMLEVMKEKNIDFFPALAYPYGGFPRKEPFRSGFRNMLKQKGIVYGLRIGNRINKWPFKNPYEIQRIDIKGNESLLNFRIKLKF